METLTAPTVSGHSATHFEEQLDAALVMNALLNTDGRAAISDKGTGRAILVLHGGGGVSTVFGLSQALVAQARVILPTHPGFDGTPRPAHLASVTELAHFYLTLLEKLGLDDVVVIGSSIGGWIAAEMAVINASRIKGLILLNSVGIQVPGETLTDVSRLTPPELIRLASHNPELILRNMPPPTAERQAIQAANAASLAAYTKSTSMMAPGLREKLALVAVPVLVLWGESDGIAAPNYGKAYAEAFAKGKFELITEAGHLPQIEQPARVLAHIENFISELDSAA
ncbi:alpha/beta fold hydrolase [Solimicrobium silvestre]|uniref:Putative hydrolases or acyltransferases (Alpha/beta hydrolase superfamily) n=1 Tax=Solimicrobium silvestre TaxID=2099400 RepID=A0A2S9GZU2_9BURK|nr:alpha/beta hydrolase [Solimicrobium silvestre]PRC93218.1 putative hydrolases or acyltransferases (alpha/beta hydrolase superfamily) [Solimicrobium silvestre]